MDYGCESGVASGWGDCHQAPNLIPSRSLEANPLSSSVGTNQSNGGWGQRGLSQGGKLSKEFVLSSNDLQVWEERKGCRAQAPEGQEHWRQPRLGTQ